MKKITAYILIIAALAGLGNVFPAPALAVPLFPAPYAEIMQNNLFIDGSDNGIPDGTLDLVSTVNAMKYQILLVRADERVTVDVDVTETFINTHRLFVNPHDMKIGCVMQYTNRIVELTDGDSLYIREVGNSGLIVTEWKRIVISADMFVPNHATHYNQLPDIEIEEASAVLTLPDNATRFEYAIVRPGQTDISWTPVGDTSALTDLQVTVGFMPSASPYQFRVRIQGDDAYNYLYKWADGIPVTTPKVFLNEEVAGPFSGGKLYAISTDGGEKYTTFETVPGIDGFFDLAKVFGKKEAGIIIKELTEVSSPEVSNPPADGAESIQPPPVSEEPKFTEEVIFRATYNPRAVLPKLKASAVVPDKIVENFSFTGVEMGQEYQYRIDGQSAAFLPIDMNVGLPLLTAQEQASGRKTAKVHIRVAANERTRTPASASKKFTQMKQPKAPKAKPDYKKEIIKIKNGMSYALGYADDVPEDLDFTDASGTELDIADSISDNMTVFVYLTATEKKPRSAIQVMKLAPRFVKPDDGEGITLDAKGKAKLVKGFEVMGENGKWGGLKKGETSFLLRQKNNAKYNTSSGSSTGNAASNPNKITLSYSEDGKKVERITMEKKEDAPLESLIVDIPANGNAVMAYTSVDSDKNILQPGVVNYFIAQVDIPSPKQANTSAFSVQINETSGDDGTRLVRSVTLTSSKGREIPYKGGYYDCSGSVLDEVISIRVTPVDTDKYRETAYTLTVIKPLAGAVESASFGQSYDFNTGMETGMGWLNVTMVDFLGPDDHPLTLTVDLVRLELSGDSVIHTQSQTFEYSTMNPFANNDFVIDLREPLFNAGRGLYQAHIYANGVKNETSDSAVCISGYTEILPSRLRPWELRVSGVLKSGTALVAESLTDYLGWQEFINDPTFTIQWIRSSRPVSESVQGTEIEGATDKTYVLTETDVGYYIGVKFGAQGVVRYKSLGVVSPP